MAAANSKQRRSVSKHGVNARRDAAWRNQRSISWRINDVKIINEKWRQHRVAASAAWRSIHLSLSHNISGNATIAAAA